MPHPYLDKSAASSDQTLIPRSLHKLGRSMCRLSLLSLTPSNMSGDTLRPEMPNSISVTGGSVQHESSESEPEPGIGATIGGIFSLFASLDPDKTLEERNEIYQGMIEKEQSRTKAKSRKYRRAEATYEEVKAIRKKHGGRVWVDAESEALSVYNTAKTKYETAVAKFKVDYDKKYAKAAIKEEKARSKTAEAKMEESRAVASRVQKLFAKHNVEESGAWTSEAGSSKQTEES